MYAVEHSSHEQAMRPHLQMTDKPLTCFYEPLPYLDFTMIQSCEQFPAGVVLMGTMQGLPHWLMCSDGDDDGSSAQA